MEFYTSGSPYHSRVQQVRVFSVFGRALDAFPQAIIFANICLPETEGPVFGAGSIEFRVRGEPYTVNRAEVSLKGICSQGDRTE